MAIQLKDDELANTQQMEVAVNGPDGATHLILCSGVAQLGSINQNTYTFLVGPQLSRRQFIRVIASGAISTIQAHGQSNAGGSPNEELGINLLSITANYDDEAGQVKVEAKVSFGPRMLRLSINYNVSILAEMPAY